MLWFLGMQGGKKEGQGMVLGGNQLRRWLDVQRNLWLFPHCHPSWACESVTSSHLWDLIDSWVI